MAWRDSLQTETTSPRSHRKISRTAGAVEVLIDKGIAEIFVGEGARYITRELPLSTGGHGLELKFDQKASVINHREIYEMKSMWRPRT